jgi:tetratricopeptide (TPR) repeat protein
MRRNLAALLLMACALLMACGSGSTTDQANTNANANEPYADITDANQALALGNQLLDNNETEKSIDAFLRATKLDPDLAEAWFKLGIAYGLIEKEQALEAKTDVNATGDANSQSARTNSEKAFRKAVEAYKKLLANNPDDDVAQFNLGRAYNKLNDDENAAKALRQAVRLKPDDAEYQTELGAILIKLAQYHDAIPPLKKALELDPDNSRAADLLDDAEAGRNRVDYTPPPKNANANANANANVNANVSSNSNAGPKPSPTATPKSETHEKPTPKPANKP